MSRSTLPWSNRREVAHVCGLLLVIFLLFVDPAVVPGLRVAVARCNRGRTLVLSSFAVGRIRVRRGTSGHHSCRESHPRGKWEGLMDPTLGGPRPCLPVVVVGWSTWGAVACGSFVQRLCAHNKHSVRFLRKMWCVHRARSNAGNAWGCKCVCLVRSAAKSSTRVAS